MGGLLLVAPEHRLSLQLKGQELWIAGSQQSRGAAAAGGQQQSNDLAVWAELQSLASLPYLDLLDESDELLHHRRAVAEAACMHSCRPSFYRRGGS